MDTVQIQTTIDKFLLFARKKTWRESTWGSFYAHFVQFLIQQQYITPIKKNYLLNLVICYIYDYALYCIHKTNRLSTSAWRSYIGANVGLISKNVRLKFEKFLLCS